MDRRDFLSVSALGTGYLLLRSSIWNAPAFHMLDVIAVEGSRVATESEMVIHGVEIDLAPASIPANKDLLVFGDIVSLSNDLVLPGRQVRIHARRLVFNGFGIDTSGGKGGNAPGNRATDGVAPSGTGNNGESGGPGGNGGDVLIMAQEIVGVIKVKANGGDGGSGQTGGTGGVGGQGAPGADNRGNAENSPCGPGQQGQIGRSGGTGGKGGVGGSGGSAGHVQIKSVSQIAPQNLQLLAIGGSGGQGGNSGQGGAGGIGGIGGVNTETRHSHQSHGGESYDYCRPTGRAPNGPSGRPGDPGASGTNGVPGTSSIRTPTDAAGHVIALSDYKEIARYASINQLLLTLHAAELDYLNGNNEPLSQRIAWLQNLIVFDDACSTSWWPRSVPNTQEIRSLRGRIATIVSQIQTGLDFYGLPSDYVPLIALDLYKDIAQQVLNNAKEIEGAFLRYHDTKNKQDDRLAALDQALHAAKDALSSLTAEEQRTEQSINEAQNAVADLTLQLQAEYTDLIKADEAFRRAVASRASCDLASTLQFVGSVVSVASGSYTGMVALVGQAQKLGKPETKITDIVTTVKMATNTLDSMKTAFNDVRALIARNESGAKVAMAEEDIDNAVKPYLDMPDAQNYRALAHLYFETAKVRNAKQMEYTSLVLEAQSLTTKISQQVEEIARTEAKKAETNDPDVVEAVVFMGKLLDETKQRVIRALYKERRCFEYWTLTRGQFSVQDQDVSRLIATHNDLLLDELEARESRNRADQSFTGVSVEIKPEDDPTRFAAFKRTGHLSFHITPEHPSFAHGFSAVTVSEVTLVIPGAKTKGGILTVVLTHSGRSTFLNPAKQVFHFTHKRRVTNLTFSLTDPTKVVTPTTNNLGGEAEKFAYVSPFAVWTLSIDKAYNPELDLENVESVNLSFNGHFLPFLT